MTRSTSGSAPTVKGWERTVVTTVPSGRWHAIVSDQKNRCEQAKLTLFYSPVQAVALWFGRQHDEAVGYQDGSVLEDLGIPDCGQAGCVEVSQVQGGFIRFKAHLDY